MNGRGTTELEGDHARFQDLRPKRGSPGGARARRDGVWEEWNQFRRHPIRPFRQDAAEPAQLHDGQEGRAHGRVVPRLQPVRVHRPQHREADGLRHRDDRCHRGAHRVEGHVGEGQLQHDLHRARRQQVRRRGRCIDHHAPARTGRQLHRPVLRLRSVAHREHEQDPEHQDHERPEEGGRGRRPEGHHWS